MFHRYRQLKSPNYELQKEALRQTLLTEKAQEEIYDITGTIEDLMTDGLTLRGNI